MGKRTFQLPPARGELRISILLGLAFALGLFLLMALTQMLGDVRPSEDRLEETTMAFEPPEIEELDIEPPPEEEEPPPELEEEPPQLSLDQLDIALNPGTGGSLAGDFALPKIEVDTDRMNRDFVDFSNLDQVPRPIGVTGLNFPQRLLKKKVNGRIVLLLKLSHEGKVVDVEVAASTLPDFDDFVAGEVKRWKFTPPTQQGKPVNAQARLPIPIQIN
jgi:periplasmic protein TonB